jgi:hypothetical protein
MQLFPFYHLLPPRLKCFFQRSILKNLSLCSFLRVPSSTPTKVAQLQFHIAYFNLHRLSEQGNRLFWNQLGIRRSECRAYQSPLATSEMGGLHKSVNPLTPKLNPSAQRCLTRFFTEDFASWTVHFVNICVKTQHIHQLLNRHNTPIHNIVSTAPQLIISQKALGTFSEDGNVMPKHVGATT